MSSDGEVQGVGMLIASDKSSGRLMVLTPLDGSPAARAGVKPGDEVSHRPPLPTLLPPHHGFMAHISTKVPSQLRLSAAHWHRCIMGDV